MSFVYQIDGGNHWLFAPKPRNFSSVWTLISSRKKRVAPFFERENKRPPEGSSILAWRNPAFWWKAIRKHHARAQENPPVLYNTGGLFFATYSNMITRGRQTRALLCLHHSLADHLMQSCDSLVQFIDSLHHSGCNFVRAQIGALPCLMRIACS